MSRSYAARRLHLLGLLICFGIAMAGGRPELNFNSSNPAVLQTWIDQASSGLDPRALDTLGRITGNERRLLAVRAYLRAGDALAERWSWSQQRLSAYASTAEGKSAAADIERVAAVFATANPGYALQVNLQPRSLEIQIDHWNQNPSVAAVAAALTRSLEQRFANDEPTANAVRQALIAWRPTVAATLAAPGLSAHGQGRAFDFQIVHSGKIAAGTDAASARQRWDAAGWTARLQAAVRDSGAPFVGPLESPYEPWHYAYNPAPSSSH